MMSAICAACGAKGPHGSIRCLACGKPLMFASPVSDTYILKGHTPIPVELEVWACWVETADRRVRDTARDDVRVSTVFLGLDHSFGHGPPLLFETMLFVMGSEQGCERYCTWAEAEAGHKRWVKQTFKATPILALPTQGDA
jgi:hypothetical protein